MSGREPAVDWPELRIEGLEAIASPSLIVFVDRVRSNVASLIACVGGAVGRLRPHVKTHKMPELVRLIEREGIRKHKCATIAEAEMLAEAGAVDVLLAYPLVGPNVERLGRLRVRYPGCTFRATVDSEESARGLSESLHGIAGRSEPLPVLLDLDVGMGRTGLPADDGRAEVLYTRLAELPGLIPDGLHAYDGHVRDADPKRRWEQAREVQRVTLGLRDRLRARGLEVPRVVFGGTPSFPAHAALVDEGVVCSPGTLILHDASYALSYPELPFRPAAGILTRVVSRPGAGRICLDVGHKAIAADPPAGSRVVLPAIPDAVFVAQSEEHLVVDVPGGSERFPIGTALLAIPGHVCPTCALHDSAMAVEGGKVVGEWRVTARSRRLTI
jgi:D-serine deaminase-like pyridoxal phosphate-dependent protein